MKKKILAIMLALTLILSVGQVAYATAADGISGKIDKKTSVYLLGKKMKVDVVNYKNELYVPLMDACAWFDCDFGIDNESREVSIYSNQPAANGVKAFKGDLLKATKSVEITANNYNYVLDGMNTYMSAIACKGEVFIPLSYFAKLKDCQVNWQKSKNKLMITMYTEKSIGTVNGESITQRELDYYNNFTNRKAKDDPTASAVTSDKKKMEELGFRKLVANKVIDGKLVNFPYKFRAKDFVNLNERLMSIVSGFSGIKGLSEYLDKHNLTMAQVIRDVKLTYIRESFAKFSVAYIEASDSEIAQYYGEHSGELKSIFQVRAKHILISTADATGASAEEKSANAKKKAEDILARIKTGESFDKLMNEFTNDPGTKASPNGYTFGKGLMVKEFEDAAFALKVGEVSGLVETVYGYHIIKVEEIFPVKLLTLDQSKSLIKDKLDTEKKQKAWDSMVQKWTDESKITNLMN